MSVNELSRGMWVESAQGTGRILVIDRRDEMVLLENSHHQQWASPVDEIEIQEQMHQGCEQYY